MIAAVSQEALDWAEQEAKRVDAYKAENPDWESKLKPLTAVYTTHDFAKKSRT